MQASKPDRKARGQAKAKNSSKNASQKRQPSAPKQSRERVRGAAQFSDQCPRIGMKDLVGHMVSWIAGTTYVGDGTNGASGSVYFKAWGSNLAISGATGGGQVPLLGSDTNVGQTYVSDIEKHYSRKIVRSARLRLVSTVTATTNSAMVVVAPVRGAGASGDTVGIWGATTAAPTNANTMSMAGAKSCASYENMILDLTPYIAGGSGAKQNEFSINRDGDTAGTAWGSGTLDLLGIAPAAFVVAGTCTTAALNGASIHLVVIETVVDYLDFIAGNANPNPLSLVVTRDEAMQVLKLLMAAPQKEVRDFALVKALVRHVSSLGC